MNDDFPDSLIMDTSSTKCPQTCKMNAHGLSVSGFIVMPITPDLP